MSTTQSTQNTDTPNTESPTESPIESPITNSENTNTSKEISIPQTDSKGSEDSIPSFTFADAIKTLIKPTDLDKPINYYQYDTNPNIVNIITGEDDVEKTDDTNEIKETEDVETTEFIQPVEKDYNNDIYQYDNEVREIPENLLPRNFPTMATSDDEIDIPEKDDSKEETNRQIYTRNPYISTLVFFIPAVSFVMIIMGFRGMLTFDKFVYALGGASLIWFILSWVISSSNLNAPTQGLFTSGGDVNKGSDSFGLLTISDTVLKMIDEILIKAIFSIVNFFTEFFKESLKIINIRKMFFLLSLSLTMMAFLYILNIIFPLPFKIPSTIL